MALSITKLNSYKSWAKADSGYNTAVAMHKAFTVDASTNVFTCSAHGLVEGQIVWVNSTTTLPAPLTAGTDYYVLYLTSSTFKLSLTSGGAEIDITTTGTGTHNVLAKTLALLCTDFPDGVFAVGDEIQVQNEFMFITAVNYTTNYLTVSRSIPVNHATNLDIYFCAFPSDLQETPFQRGELISNQTRAGEGIIYELAFRGFSIDDYILTMKFVIISGDFQPGDHCHTSGGHYFSFNSKVTSTTTTEETIVVNGTMSDTDSTANTNEALDDSEVDITVTSSAVFYPTQIIRIDDTVDEYCYVAKIIDATTIRVARGLYGTIGSHNTGKDIYIVDTNLFEQMRDASDASIRTNTAQAGAATTITLDTGASASDDFYNGNTVEILSGTGYGQERVITDYVGSTKVATVATWTTNPDNTSIFKIKWGLSDCSSGKIKFDCKAIMGRPDQTAVSILISSLETADFNDSLKNDLMSTGNASYRSYFQLGRGYFDSGTRVYTGMATLGSTLTCQRFYSYVNSTFNLYDSHINALFNLIGACFIKNSSIGYISTCDPSVTVGIGFLQQAGEESKVYNLFINNCFANFAGTAIDMSNLYSAAIGAKNSTYYVYSIGDATIRNYETIEEYDTIVGGFIATGTKTLIDCKCKHTEDIFFGSNSFSGNKSFNCKVLDELGNPIQGAQVKCNYRLTSSANVFTVLTDVNGDIAEQLVQFVYYTSGVGGTETKDIEYFITKPGYKTLRGRINIQDRDDPIKLKKVMKKNRFREEKSV
jgi:hypothetical protein